MRTRTITVQFCVAEWRGGEPWPDGKYPAENALQAIAALPPEGRRMQYGRLFLERVGNVTGDAPYHLLSVENVETGAELRISRRGALSKHRFPDDEGPAEPTYLMFFEHNIVALVRLTGGPRAEGVAAWPVP